MKTQQLAFVLSGGGARGALQVGALRALLEAGRRPDLLVGTSVGAVNAAFLALKGFTPHSLDELARVWGETSQADLLPSYSLWLALRALLGHPSADPADRLRDFFIAHGLTPELRFKDLHPMRLILVASDLNSGGPVLYGQNPGDSILEGVLASTALPPLLAPIQKDGCFLVDGGTVSNLPIEPALAAGASEIVALDLIDPRDVRSQPQGMGPLLDHLIYTVERRQQSLELALAAAQGVPVTHLHLFGPELVPITDFRHTGDLIASGYQIARRALSEPAKQGAVKKPARPYPRLPIDWLRDWWFGEQMP